jgi:hypothetical protein
MSTGTADLRTGTGGVPVRAPALSTARSYFASDGRRTIQTALGLIWLVDGGLQFQSFMYGNGFIHMMRGMMPGQAYWISSSIGWATNIFHYHQMPLNTGFALVQIAIGLGLLYRRTVKPALATSFAWAFIVWWFGEAFGMLFMNMANPLTGAPGAVAMYALIGLIAWPNGRPGGLLGVTGTKLTWAGLWVLMGALWLLAVSSSADATRSLINAAPSGMSWLSTTQDWAANAATGNGLIIALALTFLSFAIGIAVAVDWHPRTFLAASIVLNLAYWVLGQGFGGIFEGDATDPNSGPLFILLAYAIYTLLPFDGGAIQSVRQTAAVGETAVPT